MHVITVGLRDGLNHTGPWPGDSFDDSRNEIIIVRW